MVIWISQRLKINHYLEKVLTLSKPEKKKMKFEFLKNEIKKNQIFGFAH